MPTTGPIERCEHCGSIISEREIGLYTGMVSALWRVFNWCKTNNVYKFNRKDVKHLFRNENDTARFGDWVMFGGLVFKEGKAHYGLNMQRCELFFANRYSIPKRLYKNPITNAIRVPEYTTIRGIPKLTAFLDSDGDYIARYVTTNL